MRPWQCSGSIEIVVCAEPVLKLHCQEKLVKNTIQRRDLLAKLGLSAAVAPFFSGLPCARAAHSSELPKRLIILFTPNGTVPGEFWPQEVGPAFQTRRILKSLDPWRNRTLLLNGISNRIGGDGDRHMRGMSCLLTGSELFPGNIQGGSDTPAGWAKGISIDQEIRNHFQKEEATRTQFGSLEFGVAVPNRADPWTRMSYAGPNQPITPINDPAQVMRKLYGSKNDREDLISVIDPLRTDLKRLHSALDVLGRNLLEEHITLVRELELELEKQRSSGELTHPVPDIDPDIELVNDNTPQISRMQIDLMVNALANDMTRIATLQYMRSVGQARMNWLGIEEGHHALSHEPDKNADAVEKLIKINEWFAGELAYLVKKLDSTREPGRDGSMLDHTLVIYLNELGKGNSHSLDNIPFVLIGGEKATGWKMGLHQKFPAKTAHNRLLVAIGNAMGHPMKSFGIEKFCEGGALNLG